MSLALDFGNVGTRRRAALAILASLIANTVFQWTTTYLNQYRWRAFHSSNTTVWSTSVK